jgi:hypothetical protein
MFKWSFFVDILSYSVNLMHMECVAIVQNIHLPVSHSLSEFSKFIIKTKLRSLVNVQRWLIAVFYISISWCLCLLFHAKPLNHENDFLRMTLRRITFQQYANDNFVEDSVCGVGWFSSIKWLLLFVELRNFTKYTSASDEILREPIFTLVTVRILM